MDYQFIPANRAFSPSAAKWRRIGLEIKLFVISPSYVDSDFALTRLPEPDSPFSSSRFEID